MTSLQADVALLTDCRYEATTAAADDWYLGNILRDDRLLQAALGRLGLTAVRVDWARPDVEWSSFRCAVFRSTWDYFDRIDEFKAWLKQVRQQTILCNSFETVSWNLDKHYLADLNSHGIPVVPSYYVERGSRVTLQELLDVVGWDDAVIKPCISGAARHTYRVDRKTAAKVDPIVRELLGTESLILQPFQQAIIRQGEDTLIVIKGRFTHAVRKVAKAGDFRVQDDFGGTVRDYCPSMDQIELAERAVAVRVPAPAYGRVDMVRDENGGLAIMELELIEPELWLRHHPPAATAMAEAIAQQIASRGK